MRNDALARSLEELRAGACIIRRGSGRCAPPLHLIIQRPHGELAEDLERDALADVALPSTVLRQCTRDACAARAIRRDTRADVDGIAVLGSRGAMTRWPSIKLSMLAPIALLCAGCSDDVWFLRKGDPTVDPPIPPEMPVKPPLDVPKPVDTAHWSRELGTELGTSIFTDHTVDADGNVILVGTITSTVEFQGTQILCVNENEEETMEEDVIVVKLDPKGSLLWAKSFGDTAAQLPRGVAVDSEGSVLVTGTFWGSLDFGGGALISAGDEDIFVAKLDKDGGHVWSAAYGGAGYHDAGDIAVDKDGSAILTGTFYCNLDFGLGPLECQASVDAYVAKIDEAGAPVWTRHITGDGIQSAEGVLVDSTGNIFVSGDFSKELDAGGAPIQSLPDEGWGSDDFYIVKLDGAGETLWARGFGDAKPQYIKDIAADGQGGVVLFADIYGSVDFGGASLTASEHALGVVKLDAGGEHVWSDLFLGAEIYETGGVAVDGEGNVFLTGVGDSGITFGTKPLGADAQSEVFVVKLDSGGEHVWGREFGDPEGPLRARIAVDGAGDLIVAGSFYGVIDFGYGLHASLGVGDAYVAKLPSD
jgi:hypothetical protein